MSVNAFHPAVRNWFNRTFTAPTQAQLEAWPAIKSGQHTLIAAPTGSGKTLAAFLAAIDDLVWRGLNHDLFGQLKEQVQILYVSPLKALSNDIQKNLEIPLAGIRAELCELGWGEVNIRTMVRTGDTPSGERERMRRKPPHILVTTPESLYILLTSDSGRRALTTVRTLIIDEIHALAGNKRGAHLALSIERLQALCDKPLTRVGLSATQKPIHTMARFLTGQAQPDCTVIDVGYQQDRDLAIELTPLPLEAILSSEGWEQIYMALCDLIQAHRTTLIFVNTRRQAERIAKALSERLGEQTVGSHHGSLAREHRLAMEQRLKSGQLQVLVATASLELGIDIGDVDLVCQIGSPRALNTFLQRVGRSGHAVHGIPKGRLFPTSLDDLVECMALLQAIRAGELDRLSITQGPLDVLAQQLVAEVSCREWQVDDLFALTHRVWPYHDLARDDFDAVVAMLADGFSTRRGRRSAWLHYDAVNGLLRARRGAKLAAVLNGGVIPDLFDYDVILQPESLFIGTLNEDFAFESLPGDIFQLGNISYRILKIERSRVLVEDAHGHPPNIPFWFGEAPGRSDELSMAVSRLRNGVDVRLDESGLETATDWLSVQTGVSRGAARQAIDYLAAARAALGRIPTQENIVFERFFDEAGDQHLVIHTPFGSRLNRAWGLALRKRFCRKFNFELQAAALEDTIVLSLGNTHSFPLDEVAAYLKSATAREVLIQALLDAPMFATHWRWNATVALAVRRNRNGKRVAPQLQRMDAEDLLALIFPDQLACLENVVGNRVIPEHPLVHQTIDDCLNTVMDIRGFEALLRRIEAGKVKVTAMDLVGPSPLAQGILAARPYAFLDNAPAEERRTQMVQARNFLTPQDAAELGRLDSEAIARVRAEAWPEARNADELHDALMLLGFITEPEAMQHFPETGRAWLERLSHDRRACVLTLATDDLMSAAQHDSRETEISDVGLSSKIDQSRSIWVCAERLCLLQALFPRASAPPGNQTGWRSAR